MRTRIMGWLTWVVAVVVTALIALVVIGALLRAVRWVWGAP